MVSKHSVNTWLKLTTFRKTGPRSLNSKKIVLSYIVCVCWKKNSKSWTIVYKRTMSSTFQNLQELFFFIHFADTFLWWRHRRTGRDSQYWLRLEVVTCLLWILEGLLLQDQYAVLRMLHCYALGLRVCIHCFCSYLVYHTHV